MSRAFVREDGPDNAPLPDLPVSPYPNYVTPGGLAALRRALAKRQDELTWLKARIDRLDRMPEKAAERDIRYLEARLRSAIPVTPPEAPDEVAFATRVTVTDEDGAVTAYSIVGEDEADPSQGLIAPHSPLARALLGARVGDAVEWRKPGGSVRLDIAAIAPAA